MLVSVIIAAAGRGTRLPGEEPKQFRRLGDRPVLAWSVAAFASTPGVAELIAGAAAEDAGRVRSILAEWAPGLEIKVVTGGDERQETVRRCLEAVSALSEVVVIHDAARPFVGLDLIRRTIAAAQKVGAATAAIPPADTVKLIDEDAPGGGRNLPRARLWSIQTPQAFRAEIIREAHRRAAAEGFIGSDDTALVERLGQKVEMVMGSPLNFKITTPADLGLAQAATERTAAEAGAGVVRVGQGFDAHRLVEGRRLVIGGVEVPFGRGLLGHSDADVLAHAITDAVLGAAALDDIGTHFPPGAPEWKDADSLDLLGRAAALAAERGYRVASVDATVIAEAPRLAPFVAEMRKRLAQALGCPADCVSVKAKTTEGMGFTGRGEGIAAMAVATLRK
jgi:2-C-methyl-D-erythritol 4-phosphate cytidylyltransferase/2-C-methyl-D-erythritol 2,4-cyclodiphosphate synthase